MATDRYRAWGNLPAARQRARTPAWADFSLPSLLDAGESYLPFGNGRSYGDVCLNDVGTLVDCGALDRLLDFDAGTGVLRCEAGLRLVDLLGFAVPRGFFLPVTPGTALATVGGAIANDVHGKNHHAAGTFGAHVPRFELLRSDGSRTLCTPHENVELYGATIGGLGLTGVIAWAEIQLVPITSGELDQESVRFESLEEFFALSEASDRSHEYTVAWIDCLKRKGHGTRGHFLRANHAPATSDSPPRAGAVAPRVGVPFVAPVPLVNRFTLRAFNALYYHRQRAERVSARVPYRTFFHPLDGIGDWNRLYGRRGFHQYQCVVPTTTMRDAVAELLEVIGYSGTGSFLAVLKVFGDKPSPGWLSFPMPGATIALDFPNLGDSTLDLLDALDAITRLAGGRVYAAKDARVASRDFIEAHPSWSRFMKTIDPRAHSNFLERIDGPGR